MEELAVGATGVPRLRRATSIAADGHRVVEFRRSRHNAHYAKHGSASEILTDWLPFLPAIKTIVQHLKSVWFSRDTAIAFRLVIAS